MPGGEHSELYGECICADCLPVETELDYDALDDDYVLDVRGFSQIMVHDDGIDASEIITAAAVLVPPVAQFASTSSQFWSAEAAFHRTDDDRRVETREHPRLLSGVKFFGRVDIAEPDPWLHSRVPWTTVQRKKSLNSSAPTSSAPTFPTVTLAPVPSVPSSSPTAVGPIFHPLLLASATSSIPTSGFTSIRTYNKDV